jgi:protein SCO1
MWTVMRVFLPVALCASVGVAACSAPQAREYPLKGQIITVKPDTRELTISHEDIPGLMPGMVMNFRVADPREMEGREPGQVITATLVVHDSHSEVRDITVTGTAPVDARVARASSVMILEVGDVPPEGAFVDQEGAPRTLSDWRGSASVITFIYTRCPLPDFCPRMERNFVELQRAILEDPALQGRARLIAISFDPEYDTPDRLRAHAQAVGARPEIWTYLTGATDAVERFAATFGVSVIRNPDNAADITHNLRTVVLDSQGRVHEIFSGNDWTPSEAREALRQAVAAS